MFASSYPFTDPLGPTAPGGAGNGNGNSSGPGGRPGLGQQPLLPQVLKDEVPSDLILKYLDGVSKRVSKLMESQLEWFQEIDF